MKRIFGAINGILEGDVFDSRIDLSMIGIHKPTQAGISGSENEGSDSIVISGGYEDDEDFGDIIIYTGHGGRSNYSKIQVADQTLTRGNKALAISCEKGFPVRLIRGGKKLRRYSEDFGYRYDGLYRVEEYWSETGKSGFIVWRFRLVKILNLEIIKSLETEEPEIPYSVSQRKLSLVQRIVRDTYLAQDVKELYDFKCQVCNTTIETKTGKYTEAAHIQGLGRPHDGPDIFENIICLCPNHHVMFDFGMFSINDDLSLIGLDGKLITHPNHKIDKVFLAYHREHFYKKD